MKLGDCIQAIGWKFNHAPGIRFMDSAAAVRNCGATLPDDTPVPGRPIAIAVEDFFMVWPDRLGPAPSAEQLATYVEEWKAAQGA